MAGRLIAQAVREAAVRGGRRPGLLVVGATRGSTSSAASIGPRPAPDCPPERVLFEIGSVTKVFTSLLLAIAAGRGEVSLDDPVERHLPGGRRVPRSGSAEITLEHLATHRSGLPRLPPGLLRYALRHMDDPYAATSTADVLTGLAKSRLRGTPGERFRYSNFGAGLLGVALSHAAGTDYGTLLRDRITGPLGLRDTVIELGEEQRRRFAPGTKRRGTPAGPWTFTGMAGAGALRSTAADLLRFVRAQMGLLPGVPSELAAAIEATQVKRARGPRLSPTLRVGLGWMLLPIGRRKLATVWHDGGTGGYRSYVGFAPEIEAGAVVLSSTTRGTVRLGTRVLLDLAG